MLTGIDHVVIGVRDLDEAIRNYRSLGFTVVPGGRHPTGTHNALIGFEDGTYLELIAFERPAPEHRWWDWIQRGGGLTDVCLATNDLSSDIAAFRAAGVKMGEPSPLSRVRPDGYKLEWRLALPDAGGAGVIPFLIEDDTPRAERVPHDISHPNQVTGIFGLVIVAVDSGETERFYSQALNCPGEALNTAELNTAGRRFMIGTYAFDIVSPRNAESPLARWPRERGPSIYSLSLTSRNEKRAVLREDTALGARIEILPTEA